ncbi:MAG TPA: tetratricopeptide repeat protein [Flavipsychrobacter sp.]|nr:tetratricopeptide repeat protein [Flavipsychrobacter sp.]
MATNARTQPGTEKISQQEPDFNPLENLQGKYDGNKKTINMVVTIVLALIVGFFAYQKLYKEPRDNKAANAISFAQSYFQQDSLDKALNGDGQHKGFLKIMKQYSGTKTANLCNYYVGVCYLKKGDAKNAIKYLKDFDAEGTIVEYAAYGALGDAYMESNNVKEGLEYYNKASSRKDDNLLTPVYLYRAGVAYEMSKEPQKAIANYKRIRDEFPQSMQARDMDKALAKLGVLD